jgi:3-oxoacyl-[acyl-carrier protein] reductase
MNAERPAGTALPLPSPLDLTGRRIIVTGAASGIGRATANVLAQLGAEPVLADIARMDTTRSEIEALGSSPEIVQGDLLAPGAISRLFEGPRVHALVHCAGLVPKLPWNEDPEWAERFQRILATNVRLPIEIGHAAVEHMGAHGGGKVVLIGSVAGWTGGTVLGTPPDYAASKGAIHAFLRQLARKGSPKGVLVNAVAPGPVETPFSAGVDYPAGTFPLGRIAAPAEIAWPIAFLCTDAASYLSGEIVNVNGGIYLG